MTESTMATELTELEIDLVSGGAAGDTPDYVGDGSTAQRGMIRAH